MAINPKRLSAVTVDGIKVALFGESGAGKTYQIASLDRPFIISALSLIHI